MKQSFILISLIYFFSLGTKVFADSDILERVDVAGNESTSTETIIELSGLEQGQEITNVILENARAAIASSGVFEYVKLFNRAGGSQNHRVVIFEVKEKMTWFAVPIFSYSQTGFSGGGVIGEQNLFGRLKKGAIFADWGPDIRRAALGYRDPGVLGSRLTLSIDGIYRLDDMDEYSERRSFREVRAVEFGGTFLPGIRWTQEVTTSLGLYYRRVREYERKVISRLRDPVNDEGNDIAVLVQFDFKHSKNYNGLLDGTELTLSSQFSDDRYFSDYDYLKQLLYLHHGFTFWKNRANFVTKASVQLGKTLPYYIELMSGGAQNLRGYVNRQFRGDTKYAFNQEFMFPVFDFSRFIVRSNLFWDSTAIYFKDLKDEDGNAFKRDKWKNGVGIGLRCYLKGVAIPLFGLDFARGLEDGAFAWYLNVGAVF